jgi:hypothetical protein
MLVLLGWGIGALRLQRTLPDSGIMLWGGHAMLTLCKVFKIQSVI